MKKKIAFFTALLAMQFVLAGCSSTEEDTPVQDETTSVSESVAETNAETEAVTSQNESEEDVVTENPEVNDINNLVTALDMTQWAGLDAEGNSYLVAFEGEKAIVTTIDSLQNEDETGGWWSADDSSFKIYADEGLTSETASFEWGFMATDTVTYLMLDNAVLINVTETYNNDTSAAIEDCNSISTVIQTVGGGTYWTNMDSDGNTRYFRIDGTNMEIGTYGSDGKLSESTSGLWAIDSGTLYIIDGDKKSTLSTFGWSVPEDISGMSLIDSKGEKTRYEESAYSEKEAFEESLSDAE